MECTENSCMVSRMSLIVTTTQICKRGFPLPTWHGTFFSLAASNLSTCIIVTGHFIQYLQRSYTEITVQSVEYHLLISV